MTLLTSAIGKNILQDYLKKLLDASFCGDAREESYYSTLEDLFRDYTATAGIKNTHVTTLPKKTEAGNPDFRIWDGQQHIIGYIEAKDPSVEHLDPIETTEQLKRYRATFPNLILTNFYEFRLYRNGALGGELVDLHLLRSAQLDTPAARFQGEAGPIEKIRYIEAEGRIYLSKIQYIEGVMPEVWAYRVGGYQVCEKWLKDRKGRTLTPAEIKQYCRLVTALQKTIGIQRNVDQLYKELDPSE